MFHGSINVPSSLMDYSLSPKLSHWYPIFHPLKSIHIIILFKQNPYESLLFIVKKLLKQLIRTIFLYFYSSHPRTFSSSVPVLGDGGVWQHLRSSKERTQRTWRWNESRTKWAWKICGLMFIWYSQHGLIYYVDYMSIYINMWKIQMNPYIYMGYNMIYIYGFIWIHMDWYMDSCGTYIDYIEFQGS